MTTKHTKILVRCPKCTKPNNRGTDRFMNIWEGETRFTESYQCLNVNCKYRFYVDFDLIATVRK